ncbi:MAG: SusD/RagB family nutrient-binding outer membrane lipoprotein [Rhodothermaceae bacterium]|nr:SusD/RagB family nutrient-binding outer membrane lipoprotein [Rhodothermaceae bacterium]
MKRLKFLLPVLLVASIMVVSCENFLDVNVDPNNPTSAPIEGLMINTTLETTRNTQRVGATTSFFVQHFASPNQATGTDIHDDVSYGGTWSSIYFNLGDLIDLINQAEELGAPHYSGIAKVMKAYNLGLLVNMFGDVPYSEAFDPNTLQPAYDGSEAIYTAMLSMLGEAINEMQAAESAATPGGDDLIFGGDLQAWTRTAYALRARYLNHYSKLPSYDRNAVLTAVDNAFSSNDDDFQMNFFADAPATQNPWYRVAVLNAGLNLGGWLSDQVVDHLNGETYGVLDPRIDLITDTTEAGIYLGTRNGAGRGSASEQGDRSVLAVGSYYASEPTAALENMTYAELKFIEAEAALTVNDARAYQAYEEGIRAHMAKLGVDQADIDAYWANPVVSNQADFGIDKIMKEKYIATFLNPETWNDARRYDYAYEGFQPPANQNTALGGEMIRRVRYPDSEMQRNQAQMPQRTLLDRVFWDAQ